MPLEDTKAYWKERGIAWPSSAAVGENLVVCARLSSFFSDELRRQAALISQMIAQECWSLASPFDARAEFSQYCHREAQDVTFAVKLRRFRRLSCIRLIYADLTQGMTCLEVLECLSELATFLVQEALEHCTQIQNKNFGIAKDDQDATQEMVVIAMGKLGARELNFSSDIDLIFAFPAHGKTDGKRSLENEAFFARLGRELIKLLDESGPEGRVYRVDMRLRPYGKAGSLVQSIAAMENYYQDVGRNWERYAMIKASVIAGDLAAGRKFLDALKPFIYRRYLDFTAFEDIRMMKRGINREIAAQGLSDNIKLGRGGIREIEFFVQALQMIHGGRMPVLQQPGLIMALECLQELALVSAEVAASLSAAYVFLRNLENRLQYVEDRQTHTLPGDSHLRHQLALSMSSVDWRHLEGDLKAHQTRVFGAFDQLFGEERAAADQAQEVHELLWEKIKSAADPDTHLASFPGKQYQSLWALAASHRYLKLPNTARQRVDALVPLLLMYTQEDTETAQTIPRVVRVIEAIASRSAYLAMLQENPAALRYLVRLCAKSAWIADLLRQHPVLLDELLDLQRQEPTIDRERISVRLGHIPPTDEEQLLIVLRNEQRSRLFQIAVDELDGRLSARVASQEMTSLASALILETLKIAARKRNHQYGQPQAKKGQSTEFGVITYGTLGGGSMNYESDLDLVFVHDGSQPGGETSGPKLIDNDAFYARLVKALLHYLGVPTVAGVLYEVDVRLRPNGNSGLLVTSFDAYQKYQLESAWTWEHQALVRARLISDHPALVRQFENARKAVLCQPRERLRLVQNIVEMRDKMRQQHTAEPLRFDIKKSRGGLVDLEFISQYFVLAYAEQHPELTLSTHTADILICAHHLSLPGAQTAEQLAQIHEQYQSHLHRQLLANTGPWIDTHEIDLQAEVVCDAWDQVFGTQSGDKDQ